MNHRLIKPFGLFTLLVAWSCSPEPSNLQVNELFIQEVSDSTKAPGATFRYLALGDSYTIGESVNAPERWPEQLRAELALRLPQDTFPSVTILAETGWTTSNLSAALSESGYESQSWDLVSVLIGVNNEYQALSIEQYEVEFTNLLERAIACAGGHSNRVFVVSIPNYGHSPFGQSNQTAITQSLGAFNASCNAISISSGVQHFNITPISLGWPSNPDLIASDGLHPSGLQYQMWVDSFVQDVQDMIRP